MNPRRGNVSALLAIAAILAAFWICVLPANAIAAEKEEPRPLDRAEQQVLYQAQQAMEKKEYARARKILAAYIEQPSDKVHYLVYFTLGNVLSMEGNAEDALERYRAAANLYPDDAVVWQNMGKACYDLERYAEAGDCLARAHALKGPESPVLAYQAAVAYILANKPATARPLLESLVNLPSGTPEPDWLNALLKVYLDLKKPEEALALTRRLLQRTGSDPRLWRILSRLYIDRGEYNSAAAAMEIYASLAPEDPDPVRLIGDLYHLANIPLKAARQYEKLLSPDASPEDYEKTAAAYFAAHHMDRAIEVLQRGLAKQSTAAMWGQLAGLYYEKGDFEQARKAFEKTVLADPKNARAHLMEGYCALQQDQMIAARNAFERAARFPQQHVEARKMIAYIDGLRRTSTQGKIPAE
ncbi:tetratricopeptide repeat protein [uncultured Desulfosarcina sp.]|uniref:tetratricopeptide repeat protein n=1 Tax=uncultured Desulfosarcina sp. TaxID=218289 RepID=UPI0029C73540|nr:tetratricopeptide repeat protein [uncultured Desulfosarcina sp.]